MAYLYRKLRSPFWYIQYIDADKNKHDKSTGFRADDPNDTIKAKVLRAELEAREYQRVPMVNGAAWDYWVPKFFERHCPTKATLDRYEDAWKWVALWLQNNRIHSPRQLTYRLGIEYLEWRTTFKKRTGKIVGRNTAILELKLLSLVMGEAVRLGHADANPLVSMKIRRDRQPKKPELTDDEILEIQEALRDEPEWMQVSFEIGLHTGCRLRETRIPLSCVDFRECKITFPNPKGGEDRAFSIPMPTVLVPLLEKLKAEKRSYTLEFPFQPSRRWQQFFIKVKKTHLCFHCLRVTYVNRLRRAGVPREAAPPENSAGWLRERTAIEGHGGGITFRAANVAPHDAPPIRSCTSSKVVLPAPVRLHLDRVRCAKAWHLGITLGVCMSGFEK